VANVHSAAPTQAQQPPALESRPYTPSRYELIAFISHIGPNTNSGHYVCHIKKDGRWAIFDDEKVAASETLPRNMGYLYLFRQIQ
jgi:ubiquitin carboxyl-terminal hydrolase 5/13